MAGSYKTPGGYIDEIPKFPTSITAVATSIPAFIGHTQKAERDEPDDLDFIPTRITSLLEYEQYFGTMNNEVITINISDEFAKEGKVKTLISRDIRVQINPSKNIMFYQMQLFFANGGGVCYVISTGRLKSSISKRSLKKGLDKLYNYDGPTLIIFPEGINLTKAEDLYYLYNDALMQSYNLKNRFVIMDTSKNLPQGKNEIEFFCENITGGDIPGSLKYGAAYYPTLITSMLYRYVDSSVKIIHKTITKRNGKNDVKGNGEFNKLALNEILLKNNIVYTAIKIEITKYTVILPPSAAMAAVYSAVDNNYGAWKVPANVSLNNVNAPSVLMNDADQESLNIDVNFGKSINVIRNFPGKGTVIWGARTLAGNDNEWRYISVCRFFMMVENSIQNALKPFAFEPNDNNTWITIKSLIGNFLILQWRQGALQGARPEEAFFVHTGLGETMTTQDILDGRMIVQIGMAAIRPAEFIIITIVQMIMQN
jgi:phage tail sheath protein FI